MARVEPRSFLKKIVTSFEKLLNIIQERGAEDDNTIQIALYNSDKVDNIPPFRLVFIDEEICLCSIIGVGDKAEGKDFPQLHIINNIKKNRPTMYMSFWRYYDLMWNNSEVISYDELNRIYQSLKKQL